MDYSAFSSVNFDSPASGMGNQLSDYHKEQQSYQVAQTINQNDPVSQQKNNSEIVNNMYEQESEQQKIKEQLQQYKEAFAQVSEAYKKQEKLYKSEKVSKGDMYKALLYGIYISIGLLITSVITCFWNEYATTMTKQNQYLLKIVTILAFVFISSVLKNMS